MDYIDLQQKIIKVMNCLSQSIWPFRSTEQGHAVRRNKSFKVRSINTDKWRKIMLKVLEDLRQEKLYDLAIIDQIARTIAKISEEVFVEIIMRLHTLRLGFRVEGRSRSAIESQRQKIAMIFGEELPESNSTNDSVKQSGSFQQRWLQSRKTHQLLSLLWNEEVLMKEFNYPGHPFGQVVQKCCQLVEVKYKYFLENYEKGGDMTLADFGELVRRDYCLLERFLRLAVVPAVDMFKITQKSLKIQFSQRWDDFICKWLRKQRSIDIFRSIVRSFARMSPQNNAIQRNMADRVEIQMFNVPQVLRIEGCYCYSLDALLNFCGCNDGVRALELLANLRKSVYKDVDEYYKINKRENDKIKEVDSVSQIQIFRFLVCKMKIFSWQILGQLKYLDVVYGEEAVCCEFDQASYIHSQLYVALEAEQKKL